MPATQTIYLFHEPGVTVLHSVGDFVEWLLPKPGAQISLPPLSPYCPNILAQPPHSVALSEEDRSILWYMQFTQSLCLLFL